MPCAALIRSALARTGRLGAVLLLSMLLALATMQRTSAQTPAAAPTPPGNGGIVIGNVRVQAGNDLQRNAGQENQPPVWITIDAKGSSAVVTVGNATKVALDFHGTVVMDLSPNVQATQVLVSTGSAVIQGNQVVWNGFSLASGEIEPSIIQLAPAAGTPGPATAGAISSVNIEAKDPQSGATVNEQVAGGGPAASALRPPPSGGSPANRPGTGTAAAGAPLSEATARTFGLSSLVLLVCTLLALLLVAALVVRTGRRLEQQMKAVALPAGAGVADSTQIEPEGPSGAPPAGSGAGTARTRLVFKDGPQGGGDWPLDAPEVSIGRSPRNQIVLNDPRISDRHTRLVRQPEGGYLAVDNASTNGTLVNGERVDEPTPLRDGDELRLGSTILTFHSA